MIPNQTNANVKQPLTEGASVGGEKVDKGEWMSVLDAARALECSPGTIRRRINGTDRPLKFRKLSKAFKSKVEVLVTLEDLAAVKTEQNEEQDHTDFFGVDAENSDSDDIRDFDQHDQPRNVNQSNQSIGDTLAWMRQKLDEKDALLKEKDSKIELLSSQLTGATYRNGYLESETKKVQEMLLLFAEKSKFVVEPDHVDATVVEPMPPETTPTEPAQSGAVGIEGNAVSNDKPKGAWGKFTNWLSGKQ